MEALNLCLRAVAPRDTIALESPTYFGVLQIIESLGMKALEIPTHPRDGVSLEALELALDREKIKACLLMPNVSNPLGSTMPDAAKKRLVQMLAERDIPLIEDGVYNALSFAHAAVRGRPRPEGTGDAVLSFTERRPGSAWAGWPPGYERSSSSS
jgi:DNA-binding transcriptional MocR family regulator